MDDPQLWQEAIAAVSSSAAQGIDGWRADELKTWPPSAITQLANLFHHHQGDSFDAKDMLLLTLPIAKVKNAHSPAQIRPITLMNLIYRIWARLVTRQLLRQLPTHLPDGVIGFVPGRSIQQTLISFAT